MYFQLSICLVSPEVQHQEQLEHIESVIYFAYGSSRPPEICRLFSENSVLRIQFNWKIIFGNVEQVSSGEITVLPESHKD